jgi:hypothetical protein
MPDEFKPFIHIIAKMWFQGERKFPLMKQDQIEIDAKYILDYYKKYIMNQTQEVL